MTVHTKPKTEVVNQGNDCALNAYHKDINVDLDDINVDLDDINVDLDDINVDPTKHSKKCDRCYKTFSNQRCLDKHLRTTCQRKSHPFECTFCNTIYSSCSALSRHKSKQVCSREKSLEKVDAPVIVHQLQEDIEKLKQQIQLYEAKSGNNTNSRNTQHINSHNQQNNSNNVTININGLGKEDTSYLTEKFMTKCIKNKLKGVMDYLESKHFHIGHPENHNLKKLTKKDSFMECFDGKKWNTQYSDDILRDVFNNMQAAFGDFVETTMKDGNLKKVWLDNFMSTVGSPLEWDFSCDDYDYNDRMTDDQRSRLKERVFSLAIEHIYKNSKRPKTATVAGGTSVS
jgi:hypothetical protein